MFINADHQTIWPIKLTLGDAAAAMRRALDVKGNGYVYEMPTDGDGSCAYADGRGRPSCAVGWIAYDLAADQPIWKEITGRGYNTEAVGTLFGDGLIDAEDGGVTECCVTFLQLAQDHGYTWLEAASVLLAMAEGRPESVVAWHVVEAERFTPRFDVAERWRAAGHTIQELEAQAVVAMIASGKPWFVLDPRSKPDAATAGTTGQIVYA